jgi:CRISPR-associated protein Cas2
VKDWYLVCYDIRDDKRLRDVAKVVKGFGERLQYSLFRCHLSQRDVERLRWELSEILAREDSLVIIELCAACVKRIRVRAWQATWPEEPPSWTIV